MQRILSITAFLLLGLSLSAQSVGVVLSGGGASGMAHIGVLKALEEKNIPVDYIAGSSIGALIGGLYASGLSPDRIDSLFHTELFQLMAEGGVEPYYQYYFKQDLPDASLINLNIELDTSLQTSLPTHLRSPALLDIEQMRAFAGATAAAKGDLDSLFIPFRCVASDLTAQRSVVFAQGDLAQVVRASMSYPFYFRPIRVNGNLMMDGGLYNNFPSDVMYDAFLPDIIIGCSVAENAPPPGDDDLLSQLRAMMQERTDYSVKCENGIIIQPKTTVSLFDFSAPTETIAQGYAAAMETMPQIEAAIARRVSEEELRSERKAFLDRAPEVRFDRLTVQGVSEKRAGYVQQVIGLRNDTLDTEEVKERYFRLVADPNIAQVYPQAIQKANGLFDLDLTVKRARQLGVSFGGVFSSRPINTGMIGLRYNYFGRRSGHARANFYFGKFYVAGEMRTRLEFPARSPFFIEPSVVLNRWDHFRSFASFFDEVRPSYVVIREIWGGSNVGMALGNKGLLRLDLKYAQIKDDYYQSKAFTALDTADVTEFFHFNGGLRLERNSLNRKQHPNAGELLRVELRAISGEERTTPGSTQAAGSTVHAEHHDWVRAKVTLDKYFLPRGIFRFGLMAEGVYSTQPFFQNYTASVINSPVFHPTPESRTYFIEQFRAPQYAAGGIRTIFALARRKIDLRLEGYLFQPYKAILRTEEGLPEEGKELSDRSYLASGSLIYQSPLGPVWFNTSYIDGLPEPWVWSLNFGYVIFAQGVND